MNILDFHNNFRSENGLPPLIFSKVLSDYALKSAKWMARRRFNVFWNFDQTRKQLNYFKDLDYNIARGPNEETIMNHFLRNPDKSAKIYGNFTYLGHAFFDSDSRYWCLLYAKN